MTTVQVVLREKYDVLIGQNILPDLGESVRARLDKPEKAAVVTDEHVAPWYLEQAEESLRQAGIQAVSFTIIPGEGSKNSAQYIALLNALAGARLTRSDVIVALGGGVVGDLAGFAAATYLRGVPYVQVPTTLLAMVDSSVGGKTGIDLMAGKNLAGAFYQPALVLCDTEALRTLPEHVFYDGCAEVIKYGMLGSADILKQLSETDLRADWEPLIAACVMMKRDIVQEDEFDTGKRHLLNLGHTIGHAAELLSGYDISHGSAVAIGMAVITRAAVRKGVCPPECLDVLERLLARFQLPDKTDFSANALYEAALNDKKRAGETITEVIPTGLGKSELMKMNVEALLDWIETGLTP